MLYDNIIRILSQMFFGCTQGHLILRNHQISRFFRRSGAVGKPLLPDLGIRFLTL